MRLEKRCSHLKKTSEEVTCRVGLADKAHAAIELDAGCSACARGIGDDVQRVVNDIGNVCSCAGGGEVHAERWIELLLQVPYAMETRLGVGGN